MLLAPDTTALVLTDPQNDFLSEYGANWELVGNSVRENGTVAHIEQLLSVAKDGGYPAFVSPHYYHPGTKGPGADWVDRYKPYLQDAGAVVTSPHRLYGPQSNDLLLQLRKRGMDKVVLAGMSANLCVEAHLRDLIESGFEVAVVSDATAAAQHPDLGDGYEAAMTNFRYLASAVMTTDEAATAMVG